MQTLKNFSEKYTDSPNINFDFKSKLMARKLVEIHEKERICHSDKNYELASSVSASWIKEMAVYETFLRTNS